MDTSFEKRLIDIVEPLYRNGRDGDWDHILRMVAHCRYLLEHENGDPGIVLPTAYLHDLGWTSVDFSDFRRASPRSKPGSTSFSQHMAQGALIAGTILNDLEVDPDRIKRIKAIIRIHDLPELVFKLNDISATLVVEADRLDRYGKAGIERFKTMFGSDKLEGPYWEEAKQLRRDGLKEWFRTPSAIQLSRKLAEEMGLFD